MPDVRGRCTTAISKASSRWGRTLPSVGRTPRYQRQALAKLDWLVVKRPLPHRDSPPSGATARRRCRVRRAEDGRRHQATEVFFIPAAATAGDGWLVHQHPCASYSGTTSAADSAGRRALRHPLQLSISACKPESGSTPRASTAEKDRPIQADDLGLPRSGARERSNFSSRTSHRRRVDHAGDQRLLRSATACS